MRTARRLPITRLVALAVSFGAALAGCSHPAQSSVDHNRALWSGQRPAKYQFTFRWSCFCAPEYTEPVKITVDNGQVTQVVPVTAGMPISKTSDYRTIDGLFELIQAAVDRNADEIKATFDPTRGFPSNVSIDYQKQASDEEMAFTAQDLVILQ